MLLPDAVARAVDKAAQDFSGVATVDGPGGRELELASGLAHRALNVPNSVTTRFGMASGVVDFPAPVREWLGDDLPLIAREVTIEHLLTHTSGIGDYLDDELLDFDDYILTLPVHTLTTSEAFLPALDGFPQREEPGTTPGGSSICESSIT